jgi:DNA-binding winged helix-turn-helix (wHTH) protein
MGAWRREMPRRPPAPNLRVRQEQVLGGIWKLLGVFVGRPRQLSFGAFTLDVDSRQLHRGAGAEPVHLSPKGFELLQILIEARPRAIAKRELHERLWPATFVSEATLSSLVAEVRNALGERGRQTQFIRTLHGYGYSFAADAAPSAPRVGAISNWVVCDGREIALADGEHILGRDTDATVELRSPAVSRHHARIVIHGASATLEDLRSKNGTMVGAKPVTAPVPLVDGDEIRIGSFVLTYRTVSAKGSTKSAARS